MYKLLLCVRYLRGRYIALASLVSVTLGVATMIIVNAVMAGFTGEMQQRLHGILSDIVFESRSLSGFYDPDWHMEQIRRVAGDDIETMTATVHVPAMLSYRYGDSYMTHPVQLIGVPEDAIEYASDFTQYLQHPENRRRMQFTLREGGYDTVDHQAEDKATHRPQMADAGWRHRRLRAAQEAARERFERAGATTNFHGAADPHNAASVAGADAGGFDRTRDNSPPDAVGQQGPSAAVPGAAVGEASPFDGAPADEPFEFQSPEQSPIAEQRRNAGPAQANQPQPTGKQTHPADAPVPTAEVPGPHNTATGGAHSSERANADRGQEAVAAQDPFAAHRPEGETFDPATEQHTGAVLGIALSSYRLSDGREHFLVLPGDDVKLTFPTAGTPPEAISDEFTVVDLYESKMSEYDSQLVFVPLRRLQEDRGMIDPASGIGYVTAIQIKLRPGADLNTVRDKLRAAFRPELYGIYTWRDKQGPLLAAVEMETAILNVLLFLIIAVAGFGILAIFFMIVVEKTRDIGILKSLGASNRGTMGIFLGYGLSLGCLGSGAGMLLGLVFVAYINPLAGLISRLTGHAIFDPSIYYFYEIPTRVEPLTVLWIVSGAVAIAVLASILPARRAALLHPVEALRYE